MRKRKEKSRSCLPHRVVKRTVAATILEELRSAVSFRLGGFLYITLIKAGSSTRELTAQTTTPKKLRTPKVLKGPSGLESWAKKPLAVVAAAAAIG